MSDLNKIDDLQQMYGNYTVDDDVIIPVEYIAVRDTRRRQASGCNKISSQNTVRMWCENLHNRVIQG